MIKFAVVAFAILAATPVATAALPGQSASTPSAGDSRPICKFVLSSEPKALPYELCQTKAQWAALEASYAKDANRMVCRYEDIPGTRIGGHKICGPLNAWEARRQLAREETEKIQAATTPPH